MLLLHLLYDNMLSPQLMLFPFSCVCQLHTQCMNVRKFRKGRNRVTVNDSVQQPDDSLSLCLLILYSWMYCSVILFYKVRKAILCCITCKGMIHNLALVLDQLAKAKALVSLQKRKKLYLCMSIIIIMRPEKIKFKRNYCHSMRWTCHYFIFSWCDWECTKF